MSGNEGIEWREEKRDIKQLLEDMWEPEAIDGRKPVPQPEVYVEGQENIRSVSYADKDVVFVLDGGFPVIDAAGIGHGHETVESVIDVQIRTGVSEERLLGHPGDSNYAGLSGEIKRIFDKLRKGFGPYDRLDVETFDDEIGDHGGGVWVGTYTIRIYQYAVPVQARSVRYE